jgi:hypothetical protein
VFWYSRKANKTKSNNKFSQFLDVFECCYLIIDLILAERSIGREKASGRPIDHRIDLSPQLLFHSNCLVVGRSSHLLIMQQLQLGNLFLHCFGCGVLLLCPNSPQSLSWLTVIIVCFIAFASANCTSYCSTMSKPYQSFPVQIRNHISTCPCCVANQHI